MFKATNWLLAITLVVLLAACSTAAPEPTAADAVETPTDAARALAETTATPVKGDSAESEAQPAPADEPIVTTAEPESVKPGDGAVGDGASDLDSVAVTPVADMAVQVGDVFTLKPSETALVDDHGVYVSFIGVSDDSRCPEDVTCVWAGMATVQLELTNANGVTGTQQMQLQGGAEPSSAELLPGMTFTLLAVDPYPTSDDPIDADAYTITMATETRAIRPIEQ